MGYKLNRNKDIITAEIEALTIEDLFAIACHAWKETALESTDTSSVEWKYATFKADNYENLLTQLLTDLNSILYSRKWVFNSFDKIEIAKSNDQIELNAEILGEPFNEPSHILKEEIKSIAIDKIITDDANRNYSVKIVFETI